MSSGKHTAGPWTVEAPTQDSLVIISRETGEHLAEVYGGFSTSESDARLIAASPELLSCVVELKAELESAINIILSEGGDAPVVHTMLKRAQDAIAKATGGQS